jgi:hypothetical protein
LGSVGLQRESISATGSIPAQALAVHLPVKAVTQEEGKMNVRKFLLFYAVSMMVGLFTAFVLTVLWEWFVVPAFHVAPVSFWLMYGLTLLIDLLRTEGNNIEAEHRHKIVAVMLDACVPAERREEVKEQLTEFTEQMWYEVGGSCSER